jgi:aminopeptidase N
MIGTKGWPARLLVAALAALPLPAVARQQRDPRGPDQDAVLQCAASRAGLLSAKSDAGKRAARAGAGFDAEYYRIALDLTSPATGFVEGATRIVGRATAPVLATLELDLHVSMLVDSVVSAGGTGLSWSSLGNILAVDLEPVAATGERVDVTVHYRGWPASTGFGSFAAGTRGAGDPYVWTLSEPYGARTWWPGVDHPSDKADSVDVVVRVPDPMQVASNGLLAGTEPHGDGTTTWTWEHRYPVSSYLVSIAAGVYDHYLQEYVRPDSLAALFGEASFPIEHFAYPGSLAFEGTHPQTGWRRVTDVMPVLEWWYGPYPFQDEKYGHAHFTWGGGMEHQTITSMGGNSVGLIAHELAHQWYGDAVGPRTWPHLWLNEGFATMGELIVWGAMSDVYPGVYETIFNLYYDRALRAQGTLVLEDTSSVSDMFAASRVYSKGGMVLHMLRSMTGDEVFRDVLRAWAMHPGFRYSVASTSDFRRVAEEVTGLDLERFFEQWVTSGTGHPEYRATWTSARDRDRWIARITLDQVQAATESSVFVFEMPVVIRILTDSGEHDFVVLNDERSQVFHVELGDEPREVIVDPDRRILRAHEAPATFGGETPPELLPSAKLISIHPNPSDGALRVRIDAVGGRSGTIQVVDAAGRLVRTLDVTLAPGGQTIDLDVGDLAAGVYVVRLVTGGFRDSRTVVLIR